MAVGGRLCFVYVPSEDESMCLELNRNQCQHIIVNMFTNSVRTSFYMLIVGGEKVTYSQTKSAHFCNAVYPQMDFKVNSILAVGNKGFFLNESRYHKFHHAIPSCIRTLLN